MKSIVTVLIILFFPGLLLHESYAQTAVNDSRKFSQNWFINASVGTSQFYGDLSNENPIQKLNTDTRVGVALSGGKMITPYLGLRGQIYYGKLKSTLKQKNEYFIANNVIEGNLGIIVNFADMILGFKPGRFFTIYGTAGLGWANWKTKKYDLATNKVLASNGYSGSSFSDWTTEFVLPAGIGLNFKLYKNLSLTLDNTWHLVNSDFLDTKKGGYEFDVFIYTSGGFTYKFNFAKEELPPQEPVVIPAVIQHEEPEEEVVEEQVKTEAEADTVQQQTQQQAVIEESPEPEPEVVEEVIISPVEVDPPADRLEYRVQVRASHNRALTDEELSELGLDYDIRENHGSDGWYRYSVGSFDNRKDAEELKKEIIAAGVTDAFIVKYQGEERIGLQSTLPPSTNNKNNIKSSAQDGEKKYRVQILCVKKTEAEDIGKLKEKYDLDVEITQLEEDGLYKYVTTEYSSWSEADVVRKAMIEKGISDAFIAIYVNGIRK